MPVVLLSYYGVALPAGCALGFSAGWGARGMVAGMLGGKLLHATAFAVLVATTDWEAERRRAARRAAAAALALGVCAALGAAALLLLLRGVLPAAFTRDQEVRALVRSLLPPLALYVVADASQARS